MSQTLLDFKRSGSEKLLKSPFGVEEGLGFLPNVYI